MQDGIKQSRINHRVGFLECSSSSSGSSGSMSMSMSVWRWARYRQRTERVGAVEGREGRQKGVIVTCSSRRGS